MAGASALRAARHASNSKRRRRHVRERDKKKKRKTKKKEKVQELGVGWGVGGTLSIFGGRLRDRRAAASLIRAARETASVSTVYTYPCQLSPAGEGIKAAASPMDHGATPTTKSAAPALAWGRGERGEGEEGGIGGREQGRAVRNPT